MSVFVSEQRAPSLFVLSGLHVGAAVSLDANATYRLGSDIGGDIVLRDDGIVTHHVTLDMENGVVRLASHADHVQTDRKLQISNGHVCESRLPLSFSIGAVRMRIAHEREEGEKSFKWPSSRMKVLLPAVSGLFFVLAYMLFYPMGVASETTPQVRGADINEPVRKASAEVVLQQLVEHLTAAGLGHLKVQAGQSQLEVSGELPVQGNAQWHGVRMWFDQTYGANYLLRSNLTQAQAAQVAIRAVWMGDSPYLIDGKGQRRYPGSMMEDGWVLEKIGQHEVVLAKNGQQHIFRL